MNTTDKVLHELREIENDLSPENLAKDGLASTSEIRRRRVQLHQRRQELIALLGREPSQQELWGNR